MDSYERKSASTLRVIWQAPVPDLKTNNSNNKIEISFSLSLCWGWAIPAKHSSVVGINPVLDGFKKWPNETKVGPLWSVEGSRRALLQGLALEKAPF